MSGDATPGSTRREFIPALLNALPVSLAYFDREQRNVLANDAYAEYFGSSPDELAGTHLREVLGPDLYGRNEEAVRGVLRGEPQRFERAIVTASGAPRLVRVAYVPHEAGGEVLGFFSLVTDITARRRAEAATRLESQIAEHMAEGALLVGAEDLVIVRANGAAERLFGFGAGELDGAHVAALTARGGDPPEAAAREALRRDDGAVWAGESLGARRDGSTFWRHSTISRFEHPEHGSLLVEVLDDISERREREAEAIALSRIATLVAQAQGPTAVFSAVAAEILELFDARTAAVSRFELATGSSTVVGGSVAGDGPPAELDPAVRELSSMVLTSGRRGRIDRGISAPIVVAGALWGCVSVVFAAPPVAATTEPRLERFAQLAALAISNAEAWDALAREAATDAVTGIANYRTFNERLHTELERAHRYGRALSLALLDIDHFKRVNDVYGHQAGDRVLAELARRLTDQARDGELVARIGGEEFAWLMPETALGAAATAVDRMRAAVAGEPFGAVGMLTVSAGVCSATPASDAHDLVRGADRALYEAKDSGRNATRVFPRPAAVGA